MSVRPGEDIHFVALLDEDGDALTTIPLESPVCCPNGAQKVEAKVQLSLELNGRGSR